MRDKKLSFKDFLVVDYLPGTGEYNDYASYRAQKRKRDTLGEAVGIAQRKKSAIRMKRLSKKIARIRNRKLKRVANKDVINRRSQRQARRDLFRKFAKGKSRKDMPISQRMALDKRVSRMANIVKRKAIRKRPSVRKLDRSRKL